jgi:small conductance mechanosensitive channel
VEAREIPPFFGSAKMSRFAILKSKNMKSIQDLFGLDYKDINQLVVRWGTNLLITVVIFVVGFWIAKMASKGLRRLLRKSSTDEGLVTFLTSLTSIALKTLVIVTGINQLGIEMTSFVAILGAAGLAIGMAFSGTLSNFAGGVMILAFKPFKVGDTILTQGMQGKVNEIQIFNTYLHTSDNKVIILPNGPVANGNITNFTREDKRRLDLTFAISYGDNLKKVKDLLSIYVSKDTRILQEPAPFIGVGAMTDTAVNLVVQVWTHTNELTAVTHEMNEWVYEEFLKAGVHLPAPPVAGALSN